MENGLAFDQRIFEKRQWNVRVQSWEALAKDKAKFHFSGCGLSQALTVRPKKKNKIMRIT